jgi:serine protease AprX
MKSKPFEKLRNEGKILGGYNFVARNENFYTGHNHGTRVLSCMGAYAEGQLIGTAPEANFYLFITEDAVKETPLEEALWVEAAERSDSLGVDIINSSLGYNTFQNSAYNYTYNDLDGKTSFIAQGLEMAFSKGMLIVNSAGNEGDDTWKHIITPADAKNALTVGAVDNVGIYAPFSSVGPTSDNRIKPNIMAQGSLAVVAYDTGVIATSNGTSFSAPIMSGLVACLWQAFPSLSNKAIFDLVVSVSNRNTLPNNNYGYGIPDFSKVINTLSVTNNQTHNFSIYPNPFNESIVFEELENQYDNITLMVTDINGRIIYQTNNIKNQLQINTQGWCSGTYLICLSSNEGLNVNMFIKN